MKTNKSPWLWQIAPLPEGATSCRREKGRDGGGLRRRTKDWMWDGDRGRWRAGRKAVQVEALAEDGHPGRGQSTESRVVKMEEGDREETVGARADQMEGGARTETVGTWSSRDLLPTHTTWLLPAPWVPASREWPPWSSYWHTIQGSQIFPDRYIDKGRRTVQGRQVITGEGQVTHSP